MGANIIVYKHVSADEKIKEIMSHNLEPDYEFPTDEELSQDLGEVYCTDGCGYVHFKNGKDYELALAGENGILVFRDSIFEAPFDDKENWNDCTNDYEKCTLKVLLEKWWEDNAPQVLKDNYTITLPEAYNILPDEMLPSDLRGKGQQWEIYKNWRNRICGHHEEQRSTWYWTKSPHPSNASGVRIIRASGELYDYSLADISFWVVPACVPISSEAKSQNLECEEHDLQPSGR